MAGELWSCLDGVKGSALAVGELNTSGANAEGSMVRGGVCATDTGGQCTLLVIDGGIVSVNMGRDKAGLMVSFARPWYEDK